MNETMIETERLSIAAFVVKHKIGMHAVAVTANPHMVSDQPMRHWLCRFNKPGKGKMQVYFSMGMGLKGAPCAADVLDCLALDAAGVGDGQSFEDWCSEYGYDTDSRKAEKTYTVCKKQAEELKAFLGTEAYSQLLWNTERL
jgi:hypothetical protein